MDPYFLSVSISLNIFDALLESNKITKTRKAMMNKPFISPPSLLSYLVNNVRESKALICDLSHISFRSLIIELKEKVRLRAGLSSTYNYGRGL